MGTRLGQLENLARKELAAQPFTEEEREFVARTISRLGSAPLGSGASPAYYGWYTELFYADQPRKDAFRGGYGGLSRFSTEDNDESTHFASLNGLVRYGRSDMWFEPTIADVHTDPMSKQALQVGIGPVNLAVIAVDNEDDLTAYVGPVFSYHEFSHPAENRLNDQEWMEMLQSGKQPARPAWTSSFVAPRKTRIKYGTFASIRRLGPKMAQIHIQKVLDPDSVEAKEAAAGRQKPGRIHPRPQPLTVELTDEGIGKLAKYPSLRSLDLSGTPITDRGLQALAPLDNLRNLSLSSTKVEGAGLRALEGADWLRRLLLANAPVSDGAVAHLVSLPHLEILDLSGTRVTGKAVPHLGQMTYLRDLDLRKTAIGDAAIAELQRALPKCRIRH